MAYIDLADDELLVLDGRCSVKVQARVDVVKSRRAAVVAMPDVPEAIAMFVSDVVREAQTQGKLVFGWRRLRRCEVCGTRAGYATYTRATRHHRKGEENSDRPLTLQGVELAQRFVTIEGSATVGCCTKCWEQAKPIAAVALHDVQAEMPEAVTGEKPRWKRWDKVRCTLCGWVGHEGEMRMLAAMFGGQYPGRCPRCPGQNLPLGRRVIETTGGYAVVSVKVETGGHE